MERIAIFPGSFDPITLGHQSIVMRALPLFDKVIIAIGDNTEKRCKYTLEQRMEWIEKTFEGIPNIEVDSYNELTVDYCKRKNAKYIIRGLRNAIDFQYEQNIAHTRLMPLPSANCLYTDCHAVPEYQPHNPPLGHCE